MKISPSIVRIKKIKPSQPKENFSATDLNVATQLILKMEGVITPIILLRTAPEAESYKMIDGNFEYYAALQAMEKEPRKRNLINAYIVESEEELPFYQKQIEVFRKKSVVASVEESVEESVENEKKISVSNQTFDIQPIMDTISSLNKLITGIVNQQNKRDLEVDKKFDGLKEQIANISIKQPEKSPVIKPVSVISPSISKFVADFNNKEISKSEFERKLRNIDIKPQYTRLILKEREKQQTLNLNFKIPGVGKTTIDIIRNNWS